jgi:hypothetical protein
MNSIDYTGVLEFVANAGTIIGTGPVYTGYGAVGNPVDGSTFGLKVRNSKTFGIIDPNIQRVANGIDITQVVNWQDGGSIRGGRVSHCFRGLYLHDYAEGVFVSDINVSDCVFGVVVDSGNSNLSNGQTTRCSVGLLISGGGNNAHGSVMGWNSRHNTFNLSCQNVTLGHFFGGCNFIGGQVGADQGAVQIYNSKGIVINGGQTAYADITVDATSQLFMRDVLFRGPVKVAVTPGGAFDAKGCMAMTGADLKISYDGGTSYSTWSGNTP